VAESVTTAAYAPRAGGARGLVWVTAATIAGNLFAYLLLLVAARVLDADDYAGTVTLLNLLLVGTVPAFAVQAVTARRVAVGDSGGARAAAVTLGIAMAVVLAGLAPVELLFLHLNDVWSPLLIAAALPGVTVQGYCQGVWQGQQRFTALAVGTTAGLVGRSGGALVGLLALRSPSSAIGLLAVGVTITAFGSLRALRTPAGKNDPTSSSRWNPLRESLRAAHAYGAFLLLSVLDLLLAHHQLVGRPAAVYAAGSVLTKGALWLPQAAASVLFASLTDVVRHRRIFLRACAALAGCGVLLTAGTAVLAPLATTVVAGHRYAELQHDVWCFAALGGALAVLQFVLASGLALGDRRTTPVVWAAVAADVVWVLVLDPTKDVTSIAGGALVVAVVAAGVAVLVRVAGRQRSPGMRRP
jgi:hypothetical protein